MKEIIDELINDLDDKKIDKLTLLKRFENRVGVELSEEICLEYIEKGISNQDLDTVEKGMDLGYLIGFSAKAVPVFCELLKDPNHYQHEMVAMLLKGFAAPTSVECLYEAAELEFEHLEYDDTYQFARKCIKALSQINNSSAIEKLWLLSESKNDVISGYAKKELGYKGLLQ